MPNAKRPPVIDRRRPNRPADGARGPCRACGSMMRFQERYGITIGSRTVTQPAWVCQCGDETFVRVVTLGAQKGHVGSRAAFRGSEALRALLTSIREGAQGQGQTAGSMRQRAQDLLKRMQAPNPLSILATDDHARYVAANPAACALTGYSQAEILKMTIWGLSAPPQVQPGERLWRRFMSDGTIEGSYGLLHKTGKIVRVHYAAATHVLPGIHVSVLASPRLRSAPSFVLGSLRNG